MISSRFPGDIFRKIR